MHLYDLYSRIGQALSSPGRLELIDLLAQSPRTVEELAAATQMSTANTSQHLQRLKQARLVLAERDGVFIRYSLSTPLIGQLWHTIRLVAEQQMVEVEQALDAFRDRRHEFEQVTAEELQLRLKDGNAILLDARPAVEYQAGHLPGALSMPLAAVAQALGSLPDDKQFVAYCRGPHCVLADDVLTALSEKGYWVARLEEGLTEWEMAGYDVIRPYES